MSKATEQNEKLKRAIIISVILHIVLIALASATRTAGVNVLIKRAPNQQRDQHDMQNHRNDYRAL